MRRRVMIILTLLLSTTLALPAVADEVTPAESAPISTSSYVPDELPVFEDIVGTVAEPSVYALVALGILQGRTATEFGATDELTRGQVATIVSRALQLPPVEPELAGQFVDIDGSVHSTAIESVVAAGIAGGCEEDRFCPQDPITRAQLASVLVSAFELDPAPEEAQYYIDATGVHADAINAITAAGVSNGCGTVFFCADDTLQRSHAAMFIARALQLVDRVEIAPFDERYAQYEAILEAEREAELAAAEAERSSNLAVQAMEVALAQIGKPYRYGASGPNAFDCSGLVYYSYRQVGITVPRSSRQQHAWATPISRSELRPGDLVFYHRPVSHVAIYIGDGRVVEAPNSGNNVRIRHDGLTRRGVVGFGRVRGV